MYQVVQNHRLPRGTDNFAHGSQHVGRRVRVLGVDNEYTGAGVPGVPVKGVLRRLAGGTNAEPEDAYAAAPLNRLL